MDEMAVRPNVKPVERKPWGTVRSQEEGGKRGSDGLRGRLTFSNIQPKSACQEWQVGALGPGYTPDVAKTAEIWASATSGGSSWNGIQCGSMGGSSSTLIRQLPERKLDRRH